jgi:hypothetical protein
VSTYNVKGALTARGVQVKDTYTGGTSKKVTEEKLRKVSA